MLPGADQRHRDAASFSGQPQGEIDKCSARALAQAPSPEIWRKEVDTVRRQGFSIDRGNYIAGVTVVAVPVLNVSGTIAQTIASVGISSQLDRATSLALAHDMLDAARAVGAQLA